MKRVHGKVGNMRKAVDWVVYPGEREQDGNKVLFVQSDKRALAVNVETRKGVLSNGKGHPGFHTVSKMMVQLGQAKVIDVPQEFIDQCVEGQAKSGDHIGGGVYIA